MTSNIEGILPILHTPFDVNDEIDRDSLGREIDWAFEQGSNGVCSAMVSEILRLTSEERVELNRLIVEMTAGRGNCRGQRWRGEHQAGGLLCEGSR